MMRAGQDPFPGIVGFGQTVLPHLERALIAGHDIILLGERGQGKTRLIRTLAGLLDEWTPIVAGCEINDHPYQPACARCRRLAAELGDDLPVSWRHRDDRYGEKLATPDTSVGDLIGDIDPVKVAEGRTLGDPETIHFGLVPRTNRGIFSLNELPDLAERIQVSLLNVLEERDIGSPRLRAAAAARPAARGQREPGGLHQPGPDHHAAQGPVRRRDPDPLPADPGRRAHPDQAGSRHLDGRGAPRPPGGGDRQVHPGGARVARRRRALRGLRAVRHRRGGKRGRVRGAPVRAGRVAAETPVARVCDLPAVVSTLRGKVEFEVSEEGREEEVLGAMLRRAIADTFRSRLGSVDLSGLLAKFEDGGTVESGELVPATELLQRVGDVPGLARIMARLGMEGGESFGHAAAALEFALEGLYLMRRLSKDTDGGTSVYGT